MNRIRIGAVSYLNTRPLVYGLGVDSGAYDLLFDLPARLADQMASGDLDVALIPSVEFLANADYRAVSTACIGCDGPVWSVKLLGRVPPETVRTLALDEGSRTSAVLAQVLLAELFGVFPQTQPLGIDADWNESESDCVLLIGDRAMHVDEAGYEFVWDLGERWRAMTQLPFVFALWVARSDAKIGDIESLLERSRDLGVRELANVARSESARFGLSVPQCESYFEDHLRFRLGERERQAMELFAELAERHGLIEPARTSGTFLCDQNATG